MSKILQIYFKSLFNQYQSLSTYYVKNVKVRVQIVHPSLKLYLFEFALLD